MALIRAVDRARSPAEVKRLCADWFQFADQARVCRQIREHVIGKRSERLAEMGPETQPDRRSAASGPD